MVAVRSTAACWLTLGWCALIGSCAAGSDAPQALYFDRAETLPDGPATVTIHAGGQVVGQIGVDHVNLDRVEAAYHAATATLALVVHDGARGGATLQVVDAGQARRVLAAVGPASPPSVGLTTPHWSRDGKQLAFVRQLLPRWIRADEASTRTLQHRGELWVARVDSGTAWRIVPSVETASGVVGWQRDGEGIVFTRYLPGDLPALAVARVDLDRERVEDLTLSDRSSGPILSATALRDGRLGLTRSAEPVITRPSANQQTEVVVGALEGHELAVDQVASERGLLPVDVRIDPEGRLGYRLAGSQQARIFDATGRAVARPLDRRPLPPAWTPLPTSMPGAGASSLATLPVPYVNQLYDTPDSFNGAWACGPTSAVMAVAAFGRLPMWTQQINKLTPHSSDYGAYVALQYTSNGTTFDRTQLDPDGNPAQGAYGWCIKNGYAYADRMQDYVKLHDLQSEFDGAPTFEKVSQALSSGKLVVLSTQLPGSGHLVTVFDTTADGRLVTNDPYGDANSGYADPNGASAVYTWAQTQASIKWFITVHGTPIPIVPRYAASVIDLAYPASLRSGQRAEVTLQLRNAGQASWDGSIRLGTTAPRDRASALFAPSWISSSRVASLPPTAPSGTATLRFEITAPSVCDREVIRESFNLLQDGPQPGWFADDGGPVDDAITLEIAIEPGDLDGDGHHSCVDCDDGDPGVFPGAEEICGNARDDDCDGQVDEQCGGGGSVDGGGVDGGGDPLSASQATPTDERKLSLGCHALPSSPAVPVSGLLVLGLAWLLCGLARRR